MFSVKNQEHPTAFNNDPNNNDSYDNKSNQSDISLGSNETDINEEEIGDIEEETATMPTPKRSIIAGKKVVLPPPRRRTRLQT